MSFPQGITGDSSTNNIREESSSKKEIKNEVEVTLKPNLENSSSQLRVLSLATASTSFVLLTSGLGMLIQGSLYQSSFSSHLQMAGFAVGGVGSVGAIAAIIMTTRLLLKRAVSQATISANNSDLEVNSNSEMSGGYSELSIENVISKCITFEKYQTVSFQDEDASKQLRRDLNAIIDKLIESLSSNSLHRKSKEHLLEDFCKLFSKIESGDVTEKVIEHMQKVLLVKCEDIQKYVLEVKANIEKDFDYLKTTFGLKEKSRNSFQILLLPGETHNEGKKVCFIVFTNKVIVYKPRSIRLDNRLCGSDPSSIFSRLNELMGDPSIKFPTYRMLPMGKYGYTEHLSHDDKDYVFSEQQLQVYYRTMGAIEALAQMLGIQDLHAENILVHNHLPYLIDLEVALSIKSLIYSHGYKDTNLCEGHSGGEKEGISRVKIDRPSDLASIELIQKGFVKMKSWMLEHRKDFTALALAFSKGRISRYIPTETRQFTACIPLYFKNIGRVEEDILPSVKQNFFFKLMHYAKAEGLTLQKIMELSDSEKKERILKPGKIEISETQVEALTAAFLEDLQHCDVPIMHCDTEGKVWYKDSVVIDLSLFDISDLAFDEAALASAKIDLSKLSLIQKLLLINIQTVGDLEWNAKGWKEIDFSSPDNVTEPLYTEESSEEFDDLTSEDELDGVSIPSDDMEAYELPLEQEMYELLPPRKSHKSIKSSKGEPQAAPSNVAD